MNGFLNSYLLVLGLCLLHFLAGCCTVGDSHSVGNFVPMFKGKNLEGWVDVNVDKDTFQLKDDILVCSGNPVGVMRTAKQYENFILEFEWKHLEKGGNAGLFIWAEATANGYFPRGLEVQVLDSSHGGTEDGGWYTGHGDVFPVGDNVFTPDNPRPDTGKSQPRSFPTEFRSRPYGEWNKYVVVAVDGVVKLSVNGKFINGGRASTYKKGYIHLESEGAECHFRNMRILELPSSVIDENEIAQIAKN